MLVGGFIECGKRRKQDGDSPQSHDSIMLPTLRIKDR
jgi:hypothetical protein